MLTDAQEWKMSNRTPAMTQGSVHVWFARLDHPDAVMQRLAENISSDEYKRAMRFRFPQGRNRYMVARALLREVLAGYLGSEPRALSFQYGRYGKPTLAGTFAESEIRFNVSHSCGGALVGVAQGREIGVDLEFIRPLSDLRDLAESCFSIAEKAALEALPEHERLRGFFDGWTRKEAYLKATGKGLSFSLQSFEVSLAPGPGRRALMLPDGSKNEPALTLVSLAPRADYSAAVVVDGCDCHLTCAEWPVDAVPHRPPVQTILCRTSGERKFSLSVESEEGGVLGQLRMGVK